MFVRIQDPTLVKELQKLEMQGEVTLAAFAKKGLTSKNVNTEDYPPVSDNSVEPDELQEVGTLAVLKGLNWHTSDGVEMVRNRALCSALQPLVWRTLGELEWHLLAAAQV